MTDAPTEDAPIRPAELAAYLAARMCHDFISPASAIVSGLDLLEDPTAQDMRADAMDLIGASARKLADLLAFTRVAFGASASAETFDARDLHKLAQGVFSHMRTMRSGLGKGSGFTSTASTMLNTAVLAPMPSASATMAVSEKTGCRTNVRRP